MKWQGRAKSVWQCFSVLRSWSSFASIFQRHRLLHNGYLSRLQGLTRSVNDIPTSLASSTSSSSADELSSDELQVTPAGERVKSQRESSKHKKRLTQDDQRKHLLNKMRREKERIERALELKVCRPIVKSLCGSMYVFYLFCVTLLVCRKKRFQLLIWTFWWNFISEEICFEICGYGASFASCIPFLYTINYRTSLWNFPLNVLPLMKEFSLLHKVSKLWKLVWIIGIWSSSEIKHWHIIVIICLCFEWSLQPSQYRPLIRTSCNKSKAKSLKLTHYKTNKISVSTLYFGIFIISRKRRTRRILKQRCYQIWQSCSKDELLHNSRWITI